MSAARELEDPGHPRHRGDRFDLHVHRVEDRSLRFRSLELELQRPVCLPADIETETDPARGFSRTFLMVLLKN
jgi:hypothetical protein